MSRRDHSCRLCVLGEICTKGLKLTFCRLGVQTSLVFTDLITHNSLQFKHNIVELVT